MAKYTIELGRLLNHPEYECMIQKALSTYPLYTSDSLDKMVQELVPKREELNRMLLTHYKWREIGTETVEEFVDKLEYTMCEIMPYYNQLYKSVEVMTLIDDPFGNVDVTETIKETRVGNTKSSDNSKNETTANDNTETTANVNSHSKNLETDMPGTNISKSASEIDDVTHANSMSFTNNSSSDKGTSKGNSHTNSSSEGSSNVNANETMEHIYTKKGNQGVNTYAHDMLELRETFVNVTRRIIEDRRITDLFMNIW